MPAKGSAIDPEILFWRRVDKKGPDDCWIWIGSTTTHGYGQFKLGAHRYSWELANGPIPAGYLVCHTCDVRNCVNPNHLFLGTNKDNLHDASLKGRLSRGENHPSAILTKEEVIEIYKSNKPRMELKKIYHVSYRVIERIKNRKTWAWLTEEK
jgi:hypothetical protein